MTMLPPTGPEGRDENGLFPWELEEQAQNAPGPSKASFGKDLKLSQPWLIVLGTSAVLTLGAIWIFSSTPATPKATLPEATAIVPSDPTTGPLPPETPARRTRRVRTAEGTKPAETTPPETAPAPDTTVTAVSPPLPPSTVKPTPGPQPLTKAELKEILKDVGRARPFDLPPAVQPIKPLPTQIAPLPPPGALTPLTPPKPLEPTPTLVALAYSPSAGWFAQVQLGEQTIEASKGVRVGSWLVRSIGSTGVVLSRGKETLPLVY